MQILCQTIAMNASVDGRVPREEPSFNWIDGVYSDLSKRELNVGSARMRGRSRNNR